MAIESALAKPHAFEAFAEWAVHCPWAGPLLCSDRVGLLCSDRAAEVYHLSHNVPYILAWHGTAVLWQDDKTLDIYKQSARRERQTTHNL